MILIILTEKEEILGVFLDRAFHKSMNYIGECESFVYSLKPEPMFYLTTGLNQMYGYVHTDMMLFGGGGEGPALTIDEDLLKCSSFRSETYLNNALSENFFNAKICEVIALNES